MSTPTLGIERDYEPQAGDEVIAWIDGAEKLCTLGGRGGERWFATPHNSHQRPSALRFPRVTASSPSGSEAMTSSPSWGSYSRSMSSVGVDMAQYSVLQIGTLGPFSSAHCAAVRVT